MIYNPSEDAGMTVDDVGTKGRQVERIRVAPKWWPCPCCGRKGRRKTKMSRMIRGIAFRQEIWLEVTFGVYRARCECFSVFQSFSVRAPKGWRYSLEVRRAVVDGIIRDQMPTTRLKTRLEEDYLLKVSTGFIYDCLDWAYDQLPREGYLEWAQANFSGVMCIDELHDSKNRKLLLATDPLNDFTIYFHIVKKVDQDAINAFLDDLKEWGFEPVVVITDGSQLYKQALFDRWHDVEHQLCVFHVLYEANKYILRAVRAMAKTLPKPKRYPRGRPKKRGRKRKPDTRRKFVMENIHLVVKRRDNWDDKDRDTWKEMRRILPDLETLRRFVEQLYALFQKGITKQQARYRRTRLVNNPDYRNNPHLDRVCRMLAKEKFEKMITFLGWENVDRTNNHVERSNRSFRQMQKTRYKRRRTATITRALWLVIHRRWLEHPLFPKHALHQLPRPSPISFPVEKAA